MIWKPYCKKRCNVLAGTCNSWNRMTRWDKEKMAGWNLSMWRSLCVYMLLLQIKMNYAVVDPWKGDPSHTHHLTLKIYGTCRVLRLYTCAHPTPFKNFCISHCYMNHNYIQCTASTSLRIFRSIENNHEQYVRLTFSHNKRSVWIATRINSRT